MGMNLADMLSYSDIQQLSYIARHYDCEYSTNSKRELIQSILSMILKQETYETMISNSSIEELRFLNSILFDTRSSYSIEELIARAELARFVKDTSKEWNPRDVIVKFRQRGWLFNGHSQQTRALYQVPKDLKLRFSRIMANQFHKSLVSVEQPALFRDEQQLIQEDVRRFLFFVSQHHLPLTGEGSMYKRHIKQVLALLSVKESELDHVAWRFGYGRRFKEYPNRMALIYDYCYDKRYIAEQNNFVVIAELGRQFLLKGDDIDTLDLYRFWLKTYRKPIKNLQSFVYWIGELATHWVTVESLSRILCPFIKPFYYDSSETMLELRIIQMMFHLGLLYKGTDKQYGTVVRMTDLGKQIMREQEKEGKR